MPARAADRMITATYMVQMLLAPEVHSKNFGLSPLLSVPLDPLSHHHLSGHLHGYLSSTGNPFINGLTALLGSMGCARLVCHCCCRRCAVGTAFSSREFSLPLLTQAILLF